MSTKRKSSTHNTSFRNCIYFDDYQNKYKNLQGIYTNYKDKYLYTVLSRKVEGLGPTKPWQPTHFGKGATSFSNPVRDR